MNSSEQTSTMNTEIKTETPLLSDTAHDPQYSSATFDAKKVKWEARRQVWLAHRNKRLAKRQARREKIESKIKNIEAFIGQMHENKDESPERKEKQRLCESKLNSRLIFLKQKLAALNETTPLGNDTPKDAPSPHHLQCKQEKWGSHRQLWLAHREKRLAKHHSRREKLEFKIQRIEAFLEKLHERKEECQDRKEKIEMRESKLNYRLQHLKQKLAFLKEREERGKECRKLWREEVKERRHSSKDGCGKKWKGECGKHRRAGKCSGMKGMKEVRCGKWNKEWKASRGHHAFFCHGAHQERSSQNGQPIVFKVPEGKTATITIQFQ